MEDFPEPRRLILRDFAKRSPKASKNKEIPLQNIILRFFLRERL
jgi:hypothetical protein